MLQLKMFVRNFIPFCPICFSIIGEILSGPMALEFLAFFMALQVCSVVKTTSGSDVFFSHGPEKVSKSLGWFCFGSGGVLSVKLIC